MSVEGKYNNQNQLVKVGIQIEIERIITEVQDALNFKNYSGIDLYKEFSSFIRMDKFSNDNYISDDLMFVLEEDIAEQINLGVKLEIKKLKKELSIEII